MRTGSKQLLRPLIARAVASLCLLAGAGAHAASHELVDLSALRSADGYAIRDVADINNRGEIVGSAQPTGRAAAPWRAYRLRGDELRILTLPPGATAGALSRASAVNDAGAIVGYAEVAGQARPVIWGADGAPWVMEVPNGARFSSAAGLNDKGAVTGTIDLEGINQAFHWAGGALQRIAPIAPDPKGLSFSHGHRVGAGGQVIGRSSFEHGSIAFTWIGGVAKALPPLPEHAKPGAQVTANGINAAGVIVGCSSNGPAKSTLPVMWTPDGAVKTLFDVRATVPGALYGCAKAINTHGVVVGETWGPGGGGAFAWDAKAGYRDLNELADAGRHGWKRLGSADAINDRGEIIGTARAELARDFSRFLLRQCGGWACRLNANRQWIAAGGGVAAAAAAIAAILTVVRRRKRVG